MEQYGKAARKCEACVLGGRTQTFAWKAQQVTQLVCPRSFLVQPSDTCHRHNVWSCEPVHRRSLPGKKVQQTTLSE
jgi:hypothetical protein